MIVVGGENLIDLVQVEEGTKFQATPGGSQYNCALALGRLGLRPTYITPISNDSMGDLLVHTLTECGVDVASPRVDTPSSLALVTVDQGQPSYRFYRDRTAERMITREQLIKSVPRETKIFQLGSLSLCDGIDAEIWSDLFLDLSRKGVICSLDPNIRPTFIKDRTSYIARLEKLMSVASVIKLSDEDLTWLYPKENLEAKAAELASWPLAKLVVLTKGKDGASMFSQERIVRIPASTVSNLCDTVGAGDTFMAALIFKLIDDLDLSSNHTLKEIGDFAAKAAAINCARAGCDPPYLHELA